jgi:hypothetical protein
MAPPVAAPAPAAQAVRRTPPATYHYVLADPPPVQKSAFAQWWEKFRRSAFGIPRPAAGS